MRHSTGYPKLDAAIERRWHDGKPVELLKAGLLAVRRMLNMPTGISRTLASRADGVVRYAFFIETDFGTHELLIGKVPGDEVWFMDGDGGVEEIVTIKEKALEEA